MTEQEFRNKYVGRRVSFDTKEKAVHCDTEEKAKELLTLAHSFGWTWISGRNLSETTYWQDLQEGICYRFDNNKTVAYARLDFYKSEDYEIVEFESEKNKPKKTKKVFDLGLFVDAMRKEKIEYRQLLADINLWALECHGLTVKEMNEKGYSTSYSWMKEVEVKFELSKKEIEVLKALKVLDFEWIARDQDNELYAYVSKPIKKVAYFDGYGGKNTSLEKVLFPFITWEDEEATSIDELLNHVENTEGAKK